MADFDDILSCNVGGDAFELQTYAKAVKGVYDNQGNRTSSEISYKCKGEIAVSDPADMADAIADFESSCVEADRFSIFVFGQERESFIPEDISQVMRIDWDYPEDFSPTTQAVSFTVSITVLPNFFTGPGDPGDPPDPVLGNIVKADKMAVNVEGLGVRTISGAVVTNGGSATNVVLASCITQPPAGWQQTYSYDRNQADTECSYEITLTRLVEDYSAGIVDGERTISTSYDEHNRCTTSYSYSYVGPNAQAWIEAKHTELRNSTWLVRASVSYTTHKTQSAQGQFDCISARASEVLELTESISHQATGPLLKELRYAGTSPLIVQEAPPGYVYEQSGKAVGLGHYPKEPPPKFATANYLDAPQIAFNRPNDNEFETSWRYRFIFDTIQDDAFPSGRENSSGNYE